MRVRLLALALALALPTCGGTLPEPPAGDGEHRGDEPQIVATMPPAGNVEIVPSAPRELKHPVWLDGEWEWTGRKWVWKEHGWQDPPAGQVYDPPVTRRLPDGRLVHYRGKWKKPEAPGAAPSATAALPTAAPVAPDPTTVPTTSVSIPPPPDAGALDAGGSETPAR